MFDSYREGFLGCGVNPFNMVKVLGMKSEDYMIEDKIPGGTSKRIYIDSEFIKKQLLFNPKKYERKNSRFSKAKIYIILNDENDKVYIESTVNSLITRLNQHQQEIKGKCSSFDVVHCEGCKIELIEPFSCGSKRILTDRERCWIRSYKNRAVNILLKN